MTGLKWLSAAVVLVSVAGCLSESGDAGGNWNELQCDGASPDAELLTISSYYTFYEHGPTQLFYTLPDRKVVLHLELPNQGAARTATGEIAVFDSRQSAESMDRWVNNQHSDGLYGDAPQPAMRDLPGVSILGTQSIGTVVGRAGEEYEQVRVSFHVDEFELEGRCVGTGFDGETDVFVLTREPQP